MAKEDAMNLEEGFALLEAAVNKLEKEDISLEDSFGIYEQGMKLIKECNDKIDRVEKKVLELNADGTLQEME